MHSSCVLIEDNIIAVGIKVEIQVVLKLVITKTYLCIFTTQDPYLLSGLDLIEWIRPLMVIDFKLPPFVSEEKSTI